MLPYVNRLGFVQSHAPLLQQLRFLCSPPASNSKLFIAGLSWSVDDRSLLDAFSSFGEVTEVKIMYDKNSGRSRGFGFVHFSNEEDAKYAKNVMNGKVLLGRPLRISYCLERVRGAPVVVPRISLSEPKD
ncbi:glycine-rich RNA-binding protein 4, mitochondrial-like [Carex rostrata]